MAAPLQETFVLATIVATTGIPLQTLGNGWKPVETLLSVPLVNHGLKVTVDAETFEMTWAAFAAPYQLQVAFTNWLITPLSIPRESPVKLLELIFTIAPVARYP